jgi:hypothetical protein
LWEDGRRGATVKYEDMGVKAGPAPISGLSLRSDAMSALSKRKLYVTAAVLLLGAIAAEALAKSHLARSITTTGRRLRVMAEARAAGSTVDPSPLRDEAAWNFRRYGLWERVGIGLAVLGLGSWMAAYRRGEFGPSGVLPLLFFLYILLLFLMVRLQADSARGDPVVRPSKRLE